MRKKHLAAGILLAFLILLVSFDIGKTDWRESAATPAIKHPSGTDCILADRARAQGVNQLGLLALNSQAERGLTLLQFENGRVADRRIYSSFFALGDPRLGSRLVCTTGSPEYGAASGTITPGGVPLRPEAAGRLLCERCIDELSRLESAGDLLLVDYAGGRYYSLCAADCRFVIRERYEVTTAAVGGGIGFVIQDRAAASGGF